MCYFDIASDKLVSFNALISKKREKAANKEYMVKKMKSLDKQKLARTDIESSKALTIKQLFSKKSPESVETSQTPISQGSTSSQGMIFVPPSTKSTVTKPKTSNKHIRDIVSSDWERIEHVESEDRSVINIWLFK